MSWLRRAWEAVSGTAPPREVVLEPAPVLTAHLLYREKPTLDLEALGLAAPEPAPAGGLPESGMLFAHPLLEVSFEDGNAPPMAMVFPPRARMDGEALVEARQQGWHWPEGGVVVPECRWQVRVTDFMARQLSYKKRAGLFLGFVRAVAATAPPDAVLVDLARKLVAPDDLGPTCEEDPLRCLCSIRMHSVDEGDPTETVMDSLGLHALGLHDVQCHFRDLDLPRMAALLFGTCQFLYDRGDVFHSGDTLEGFDSVTKFRVRTEWSLVEPARPVLDLDPGPPWSCGHRPSGG